MTHHHSWIFKKAFSDLSWSRLEQHAFSLATVLPESLLVEAANPQPHATRLSKRCAVLAREMSPKLPILLSFQDGESIVGFSDKQENTRCIGFYHRNRNDEVLMPNLKGHHSAETFGMPHDRLLVSLLCLAEAIFPGNVRVRYSPVEDDYWFECADWARRNIDRKSPLPFPTGLESTQLAKARIEAFKIRQSTSHPQNDTDLSGRKPSRL